MLIGLCGYGRAGKSTVGSILVEHHGFVSMGFADALREVAAVLNPIVNVDHWDDVEYRYNDVIEEDGYDAAKELYPEVRRFLQVLGTEVGRNMFGENFWVDLAMQRREAEVDVVFTDVRFPNEAEAIWQRCGSLARITRPGHGPVNNHPSETALDYLEADFTIDNWGTLDDLTKEVEAVLSPWIV